MTIQDQQNYFGSYKGSLFELLNDDDVSGYRVAAGIELALKDFSFSPNLEEIKNEHNEIVGDITNLRKDGTFSLTLGKESFEALKIFLGAATETEGIGDTEKQTLFVRESDESKYFQLAVMPKKASVGSVIRRLLKCKITAYPDESAQGQYASFAVQGTFIHTAHKFTTGAGDDVKTEPLMFVKERYASVQTSITAFEDDLTSS